jgi:hypothetical protein
MRLDPTTTQETLFRKELRPCPRGTDTYRERCYFASNLATVSLHYREMILFPVKTAAVGGWSVSGQYIYTPPTYAEDYHADPLEDG